MFAQRRSTPGHGWLSPTLPSVICQEDDIPEFELLGAKQPEKGIEFSFEIPARRRECFYQYLPHGSQMKFSFKVLTPPTAISDNSISSDVRTPGKRVMMSTGLTSQFETDFTPVKDQGFHEICFYNYVGRFGALKVLMFIGIINPRVAEDFDLSNNETDPFHQTFLDHIHKTMSHTFSMDHFLRIRRLLEKGDFASLQHKLEFINTCSIATLLIVLAVAYVQTYMLKRMFNVSVTTPSHKPRA